MKASTVGTIGVIGVGNRLMRDEGVGVEALRSLRQEGAEGVECIEGGTDPWTAFSAAEGCSHLIVLDAVQGGREPGSLYRMDIDEVDTGTTVMSLHGVTLFHLLQYEALVGNTFREVVLLGMEPVEVESGMGLSERCRQRLPELVRAARDEIERLKRL